VEKPAWNSSKNGTTNFLGNQKYENCSDMVAALVKSYKAVGCNMSLKVHFLDPHIDLFPENLGAARHENEGRFHHVISTTERRCKGKWSPSMLADCCWTLRRDVLQAKYSRKQPTVTFYVMYLLSVI
jgi:hypothetical protein